MDKYVIYKHENTINGKVYIGITKYGDDPNKRWRNGYGYVQNEKFFNDIISYGWNNFSHDILESDLNSVEASKKEIQYIEFYDSVNKGYNISKGGSFISEEGCQKISEALKNVPKSAEAIRKQMQTKEKRYGNGKSKNFLGSQAKKVQCIETGDVFISISDAERWCGSVKVGECCHGTRLHAGKHPETGISLSWKYADDSAEVTIYCDERIIPKKTVSKVKCIETNKIYESASEASRETGVATCNILRVCKGERKSAGKYHWVFV